jgi:PPM family protein phosphatase
VIPTDHSQIRLAAATHPGMRGKNNEDRYGFRHFHINDKNHVSSTVAIVSDGIGGHRAGEIAAQIAVDTIYQTIEQSDASNPVETLRKAIVLASQKILQVSASDPKKRGMGATCACAWVIGNRLYTASVGDTRIYWIRGDKIHKLSTDHTWVQEAIDIGALSQDQAKDHPNAHVIRRYLGSPNDVIPDLRLRLNPHETDEQSEANQGFRLASGDMLFLSSDGLTDLVEDAEILSALRTKDLDKAVEGLVELANVRGGHDNITVIALEIKPKARKKPAVIPGNSKVKRRIPAKAVPCLGLGALLLVSLLALGGFYWAMTLSSVDATPTPTVSEDVPPLAPVTSPSTPIPTVFQTIEPTHITPLAPTSTYTQPPTRPTYTPWPTSTP